MLTTFRPYAKLLVSFWRKRFKGKWDMKVRANAQTRIQKHQSLPCYKHLASLQKQQACLNSLRLLPLHSAFTSIKHYCPLVRRRRIISWEWYGKSIFLYRHWLNRLTKQGCRGLWRQEAFFFFFCWGSNQHKVLERSLCNNGWRTEFISNQQITLQPVIITLSWWILRECA